MAGAEGNSGAAGAAGAEAFYIPTLAVIGVGMIGGSLALALKKRKRVGRVIGAGRARASLEKALALGVIDQIADSAQDAARAAEVIFLAAPVAATGELLRAIAPALAGDGAGGKVVTDAGSVKVGVCEAAESILGAAAARFVPGHPVAGKEHAGVAAANADLFVNHNAVVTPLPNTAIAADALATARRMWRAAGANVIAMPADAHDRVLALTSHLPHVLAYAMVDWFAESAAATAAAAGASESVADSDSGTAAGIYAAMAAGGFYDFTRTASADAEMWRDICLMNREQILAQLDAFAGRLERCRAMIARGDGAGLERLFRAARATRATLAERRRPAPSA